jgi:hypothetical protein
LRRWCASSQLGGDRGVENSQQSQQYNNAAIVTTRLRACILENNFF